MEGSLLEVVGSQRATWKIVNGFGWKEKKLSLRGFGLRIRIRVSDQGLGSRIRIKNTDQGFGSRIRIKNTDQGYLLCWSGNPAAVATTVAPLLIFLFSCWCLPSSFRRRLSNLEWAQLLKKCPVTSITPQKH